MHSTPDSPANHKPSSQIVCAHTPNAHTCLPVSRRVFFVGDLHACLSQMCASHCPLPLCLRVQHARNRVHVSVHAAVS